MTIFYRISGLATAEEDEDDQSTEQKSTHRFAATMPVDISPLSFGIPQR